MRPSLSCSGDVFASAPSDCSAAVVSRSRRARLLCELVPPRLESGRRRSEIQRCRAPESGEGVLPERLRVGRLAAKPGST